MNANSFHRCWQLLRYLGPKWLMYRACHAVRLKSGLLRRQLPVTNWDEQPLNRFLAAGIDSDPERYAALRNSTGTPFFFDPQFLKKPEELADLRHRFDNWDHPSASTGDSPQIIADDLRRGFMRFFSHERVEVGFPPQWHADPFTGDSSPTDRHFSQIGDFGAGDIKLIWETNRFGFVFSLVRAYFRTGNERYAELFWQLVESWREANQPSAGANWKCGQEISFRVIAWCFGLYGFSTSTASTPARITMLSQMIAVSGTRIEANIGYALSQKNNHGLSEAMGLWTIGGLFPEFRDAPRWANLGRRLLEQQAQELVYQDGAFSQHSLNYHRVMLHDFLWSIRLADVLDQPLSAILRDRIGKAGDFLDQLQDESTGEVPCYGQDDGALILPLNNCGYRDYRPVVQAIHQLTQGHRRFDAGPWDEDLWWMFGTYHSPLDASTTPQSDSTTDLKRVPSSIRPKADRLLVRSDFSASIGGYATLRSEHGFVVTRAASFRHRPAQADMLHVDLWWRGENIAIDPGTYSYHAPPPWNNPFAHTAYHNTVTVDGQDQMERVSRFLWLPWLNGKSFERTVPCPGNTASWNGEHDGYRRLPDPVTHRRGILRLGADHWLVIDALQGRRLHDYRLHWLLLDAPYQTNLEKTSLELQTAVGQYRIAMACSAVASRLQVTRAAVDSAVGWRSRYYHSREPALSIQLECSDSTVVFATVLGPDAQRPLIQYDHLHVPGPGWDALITLDLKATFGTALISAVYAHGSLAEPIPAIAQTSRRPRTELRSCTSC